MSEFEISIPVPGSKYSEVVIVNKNGDRYSLIAGKAGKGEGQNFKKWCFPQGQDRKPRDKAVPWKIELGCRDDAIEVVKGIAKAFGLMVVQ